MNGCKEEAVKGVRAEGSKNCEAEISDRETTSIYGGPLDLISLWSCLSSHLKPLDGSFYSVIVAARISYARRAVLSHPHKNELHQAQP
ncbi:hypothetical protein GW17_00008892 [Ensete ventricosum]|nr:hypothetical protein GW17_00008892 [Ensete ventricosum]